MPTDPNTGQPTGDLAPEPQHTKFLVDMQSATLPGESQVIAGDFTQAWQALRTELLRENAKSWLSTMSTIFKNPSMKQGSTQSVSSFIDDKFLTKDMEWQNSQLQSLPEALKATICVCNLLPAYQAELLDKHSHLLPPGNWLGWNFQSILSALLDIEQNPRFLLDVADRRNTAKIAAVESKRASEQTDDSTNKDDVRQPRAPRMGDDGIPCISMRSLTADQKQQARAALAEIRAKGQRVPGFDGQFQQSTADDGSVYDAVCYALPGETRKCCNSPGHFPDRCPLTRNAGAPEQRPQGQVAAIQAAQPAAQPAGTVVDQADVLRLFAVIMQGDDRADDIFARYNIERSAAVHRVGLTRQCRTGQVIVRLPCGFCFIFDTGSGATLISTKHFKTFANTGLTPTLTLLAQDPDIQFQSLSGTDLGYKGTTHFDSGIPGTKLLKAHVIENVCDDFLPIFGNDLMQALGAVINHNENTVIFPDCNGECSSYPFDPFGGDPPLVLATKPSCALEPSQHLAVPVENCSPELRSERSENRSQQPRVATELSHTPVYNPFDVFELRPAPSCNPFDLFDDELQPSDQARDAAPKPPPKSHLAAAVALREGVATAITAKTTPSTSAYQSRIPKPQSPQCTSTAPADALPTTNKRHTQATNASSSHTASKAAAAHGISRPAPTQKNRGSQPRSSPLTTNTGAPERRQGQVRQTATDVAIALRSRSYAPSQSQPHADCFRVQRLGTVTRGRDGSAACDSLHNGLHNESDNIDHPSSCITPHHSFSGIKGAQRILDDTGPRQLSVQEQARAHNFDGEGTVFSANPRTDIVQGFLACCLPVYFLTQLYACMRVHLQQATAIYNSPTPSAQQVASVMTMPFPELGSSIRTQRAVTEPAPLFDHFDNSSQNSQASKELPRGRYGKLADSLHPYNDALFYREELDVDEILSNAIATPKIMQGGVMTAVHDLAIGPAYKSKTDGVCEVYRLRHLATNRIATFHADLISPYISVGAHVKLEEQKKQAKEASGQGSSSNSVVDPQPGSSLLSLIFDNVKYHLVQVTQGNQGVGEIPLKYHNTTDETRLKRFRPVWIHPTNKEVQDTIKPKGNSKGQFACTEQSANLEVFYQMEIPFERKGKAGKGIHLTPGEIERVLIKHEGPESH